MRKSVSHVSRHQSAPGTFAQPELLTLRETLWNLSPPPPAFLGPPAVSRSLGNLNTGFTVSTAEFSSYLIARCFRAAIVFEAAKLCLSRHRSRVNKQGHLGHAY